MQWKKTVIETKNLTVYYGKYWGIVELDLSVRAGEIFGFLDPKWCWQNDNLTNNNNIIRPTKGKAKIFGMDCQTEGLTLQERVGYLPSELSLPRNMTGKHYLRGIYLSSDPIRDLCHSERNRNIGR
jgi:ABC-2 type transport system ATP-binding protein